MAWLAFALCCGCLGGCVERRFVITTDPPGALILDEKNLPMGVAGAPVDRQFTYYGKYRFTVIKDGYETKIFEEKVVAPWWDVIGIDFISENLIPWPIRDIRRFHYVLEPKQMIPPEAVLNQALQLRLRGQGLGAPANLPPEPVPVEAPPPRTLPNGAPPAAPGVPVPPPPGAGTQPPLTDNP
jgi:hypothetical protein